MNKINHTRSPGLVAGCLFMRLAMRPWGSTRQFERQLSLLRRSSADFEDEDEKIRRASKIEGTWGTTRGTVGVRLGYGWGTGD